MAKGKLKTFNVLADLKISVGFNVKAENMQDAIVQAQALKVYDIVDFKASELDHNDSEDPVITGIFSA